MRPLITDDTTEPLLAQFFQTDWGGGFFPTQSWVGQENSSDEPQLLLLCSKLPTDALGVPPLTNTSPPKHSALPLSHPGWSWTAALPWEPLASKRAGNHGTELSGLIGKPRALLTAPHKYFLQEITLGCFGTVLLCKKNWPLLGFQEGNFKWCHNTF